LPADVAVMTAAVADWRVATERASKMKKDGSGKPPALVLTEIPTFSPASVTTRRCGRDW
jgi:phosphopantothenoylcysteine decarboxylase/phosphopantothenate--cysteine ligase